MIFSILSNALRMSRLHTATYVEHCSVIDFAKDGAVCFVLFFFFIYFY